MCCGFNRWLTEPYWGRAHSSLNSFITHIDRYGENFIIRFVAHRPDNRANFTIEVEISDRSQDDTIAIA